MREQERDERGLSLLEEALSFFELTLHLIEGVGLGGHCRVEGESWFRKWSRIIAKAL